MELDPTVIYGGFATLIIFILNWLRSVEKKSAEQCERRLSRVEAIIKIYLLETQEVGREQEASSYLEEADKEIFGKNFHLDVLQMTVFCLNETPFVLSDKSSTGH